MKHIPLGTGATLHIIPNQRLKDLTISIRFQARLDQKEATARHLLGMMMVDRCQMYPSKDALQKRLDMLYGASLYDKITGYGKSHVLEFRLQAIHGMYVGEDLFASQWQLLKEILEHPWTDGEGFHPDAIREAKKRLREGLQRTQESPSGYAAKQLMHMCAPDPLAIDCSGDDASLEQIDGAYLWDVYQRLWCDNQIDVFVVGDADEEEVGRIVQTAWHGEGSRQQRACYTIAQPAQRGVNRQKKRCEQTILGLLYATGIAIDDEDYWTLRVVNGMLGAYPTSLLFQQVREQRSLCYSIYSTVIAYDGALMIQTGIDRDKQETVVALIDQQLQALQNGQWDDMLLTATKDMLINQLRGMDDGINGILGLAYQNVLLDRTATADSFISRVQAVTKQDVMRVAVRLKRPYQFVLEQEADDEDDRE